MSRGTEKIAIEVNIKHDHGEKNGSQSWRGNKTYHLRVINKYCKQYLGQKQRRSECPERKAGKRAGQGWLLAQWGRSPLAFGERAGR